MIYEKSDVNRIRYFVTDTQCEVQTLLTSAGPNVRAVLALPPVYGIYMYSIFHFILYTYSSYLVDLITPSAAASARAGLRSAESMTVAVPRTLSSLGDRSFATAGPRVWNNLPTVTPPSDAVR